MLNTSVITFIPVVLFVVLLVLQATFPRRSLASQVSSRIGHNLLLFVVNTLLMRFAVPVSLLLVSTWASERGIGLVNVLALPAWFSILACVIILDFAIYWQHVATHYWPLLWRMHKVHHADTEMDVTTAIRFHPLELLASLAYKSMLVVLLGAPAWAIIMFELLLFIGPAFNHSNVRLAPKLDAFLRLFIATPDTHRAHHSTLIYEQNTNYGFFLIWWDKLFGTYTQMPEEGHKAMRIGLLAKDDQCNTIDEMLIAPFK